RVMPAAPSTGRTTWTCPMHPEVRQDEPGICPKCGMALEPLAPRENPTRTEWTCPMHPEIVRDAPGSCPICGMALEPRVPLSTDEGENAELVDMSRRFRLAVLLTAPLLVLPMADMLPAAPVPAA